MSDEHLPSRRSLRFSDYDYRANGAYFLTICTHERRLLFDVDVYRAIAVTCWESIPAHYRDVMLDEFIVMPNHVHGILIIDRGTPGVGAQHAAPVPVSAPMRRIEAGSLGAIVRSYKAAVTMAINERRRGRNPIWQRNYYEHIIRSEASLNRIRRYIIDNPARWPFDRDNPAGAPDRDETAFWADHS